MTRQLRLVYPGAVLDLLAKEVRQQGWRIFAYCLLGNHYPLLFETPDATPLRALAQCIEVV